MFLSLNYMHSPLMEFLFKVVPMSGVQYATGQCEGELLKMFVGSFSVYCAKVRA